MNILGIETSCDETAAAIVVGGRVVLSNIISSQFAIHRNYGGIVPELAARGQIQAIVPVVRRGVAAAGMGFDEIDAIAFTQGPGLAGSLVVGVNAAKSLAMSLGVPLVPINHLEAHVYANWLQLPGEEFSPPRLPATCLLVSGGHTELLLIEEIGRLQVLGKTIDDAAGEAFDKGARLLGLGYPGGPAIQDAAAGGDPHRYQLPRSSLGGSLDFSFSGLKTALLRAVDPYRIADDAPAPEPGTLFPEHRPRRFRDDMPVADLAASFEEAIVDALSVKTIQAAREHDVHSILVAGGVAANSRLRDRLARRVAEERSGSNPPEVRWPDLSLCTDNAAMVAGLGFVEYERGVRGGFDADAFPRWPVGSGGQ
ncbi:tRNA (adenosine(37)-N6)-threonylcarbamoyltransferase complex transferase subunit TsaD [soil metagenome]